jgi:hypothetical protein
LHRNSGKRLARTGFEKRQYHFGTFGFGDEDRHAGHANGIFVFFAEQKFERCLGMACIVQIGIGTML